MASSKSARTWLITGASSGLGYELAVKALEKGDQVIASSRSLNRLKPLKEKGAAIVQLDHNKSLEHIQSAVEESLKIYQKIDVVVNNAAYVQTGMLEETTPEETQKQFQANLFGPLNVYRACLPHLRANRAGLLVTIGSMAAWYAMPGCNLYDMSKAAARLMGQGLQGELAGFGIKHCLVEPGFFRTRLLDPAANVAKTAAAGRIEDYTQLNETSERNLAEFNGRQGGDPVRGVEIMYDVLTSSGIAAGREVPQFLPLGSDAVAAIVKSAEETIGQVKEWAKIAAMSDFPSGG